MNFAVGALWSESGAGTNAIGTALAADHAVQVFAAEHFNEVVQAWTCAAAPVHDPDTGRVLGVIDLTSRMSTVHPHSFAVAVATAGAVEAHLRCLMHEHDARLRSRYRDRVLTGGDDRALVTSSGRVIATEPGRLDARGARSRCRPTAASSRCPRACPRSRSRWTATARSSCAGSSTRRRAAPAARRSCACSATTAPA